MYRQLKGMPYHKVDSIARQAPIGSRARKCAQREKMARDAALEEERLLEEEAAAAAAAEETCKKEQNSLSTESQSKESIVVNLGKHNDLSNDTLHYNKECDGTILQEKKYGTTVCMGCGALGSQGEATAKDFDFDYEDIDLDYPK